MAENRRTEFQSNRISRYTQGSAAPELSLGERRQEVLSKVKELTESHYWWKHNFRVQVVLCSAIERVSSEASALMKDVRTYAWAPLFQVVVQRSLLHLTQSVYTGSDRPFEFGLPQYVAMLENLEIACSCLETILMVNPPASLGRFRASLEDAIGLGHKGVVLPVLIPGHITSQDAGLHHDLDGPVGGLIGHNPQFAPIRFYLVPQPDGKFFRATLG